MKINYLALSEAYQNYCDYKGEFNQIHKIEREDWVPNFSTKKRNKYENLRAAEKVLDAITWMLNIDQTKLFPIFASIRRQQEKTGWARSINWENYILDHITNEKRGF